MLRPKQMSKVSVAGSKAVLEDVVEELHDLNLVHITDYDGSWEGFENGNPLEGGEEVSGKLVQVRAVLNTLDVDDEDFDGDAHGFETRDELYERLDGVRERVNSLEDERNELRNELREARERKRTVEPFVDLGIDLELLDGYDEIDVHVGLADPEEVREALEESESDEYEVFGGDGVVAVAERGVEFDDALMGVEFSELEVPDLRGDPAETLKEVEESIESLEDEISEIEARLDGIREEEAEFLLAAEEELSIEAQKTDAPLHFATTTNSFYAEGWIPSESYDDVLSRLHEAVGDRVDVNELETVEYDGDGHPVEEDEEEEEHEHEDTDEPPVVQDNPDIVKPFEPLVHTINRPKYSELDPTIVVFLTFPFAFGFMIGDIGYGVLYMLMGYGVYKVSDSEVLQALGIIGVWAGIFTVIFGYLYDDLFGVYLSDIGIHLPLAGSLSKGIQTTEVALTWLVASILFGILHLTIGHLFGFFNDLSHGLKEAVTENLSWIFIILGFFGWVFSKHLVEEKPEFLVGDTEQNVLNTNPMFDLGFTGFSSDVGIALGLLAVVGVVMAVYAEGAIGAVETPTNAFGHVLSYLRIMAVLIAKGGMAFVVNILVFGAYESPDGYINFALTGHPTEVVPEGGEVAFTGLVWLGLGADGGALGILLLVVGLVAAVAVFALGHVIVLLLGITAAGIQMVRLEYVEFFGKFYEGGGDKFEPFGKQRKYTDEGSN